MWFLKVLRMLFITLDWAVYNLASLLYELFVMISETGIFRTEAMRTFANRLYFFLGLIMIFKVSISIIQYIMNPDAVKDAKLGAGKLLKNIIVILLGIVLVPYVFEMAFSLQRIVLKDNVLGNLILGLKYSGNEGEDAVKTAGNMMAFSTFTAFFHPDGTLSDIGETCETNPVENGQIIGDCGQLGDALGGAKDQFIEAYDKKQMGKLYNMDIYNATMSVDGEDVFVFTYSYLVTTIAGGFLCYLLLIFCIDIAVRSVKLGFLQLIAPIPLIAKIDPKKGDDVFNKWVKECVSTYLNLFIRLAALFFAIFIISLVGDGMFNVVTGDDVHNPFVFVFIIFGVLLFAKDLPKLIEQITGIKMSGDGLSLSKRMLGAADMVGKTPFLGNASRRAMSGVGSALNGQGFRKGWMESKKNNKGFMADMRKAIPGADKAYQDRIDNKVKNMTLDRNLAKGRNTLAAFKQKDDKDYAGQAEAIFGRGHAPVKQAYANMQKSKAQRDFSESNYQKILNDFNSGKAVKYRDKDGVEFTGAKAVDKARIDSVKAASAYSAAEGDFNTRLAADSSAQIAYNQYNAADKEAKYRDGKYGVYEEKESRPNNQNQGNADYTTQYAAPAMQPSPQRDQYDDMEAMFDAQRDNDDDYSGRAV